MKEIIKADSLHRLNQQVTEFVENHLSMADDLTIVTTYMGGEYVATIMPKDTKSAIKDLLVEEYEIIRHFWSKDDIRGINGDMNLTEEQVDAIARKMESRVDCEYGINWQFINDIAWEIAPEAFPLEYEEDDDSDPDEACERDRELHGTDGYENIEDEGDDGIDLDSSTWDTIEDGMTPEQ